MDIIKSKQFRIGLTIGLIFLIFPLLVYNYYNGAIKSIIAEELKLQNDAELYAYNVRIIRADLIKIIKHENEKNIHNKNKRLNIEVNRLRRHILTADLAASNLKSDLARIKFLKFSKINKKINKIIFEWFNVYEPILRRFAVNPKLMSKKSKFLSIFLKYHIYIFSILRTTNKKIYSRLNDNNRKFDIIFFGATLIIFFLILALSYIVSDRNLKLMEREKQFKSMFYDNSLPMFIFDMETLILMDVNESAVKYGGYPKKDIIGKTLYEINPFFIKDTIFKLLDKSKKEGQKTFAGIKFILKNKEIRDIEVSIALIYKNNASLAIGTIIDVTEKLAKEFRIKMLKRLYESLIREVSLILNPESENAVFHRTLQALQKSGIFTASWIGRLGADRAIKYVSAKGRGTQELMKIKLSADCDKEFLTLAERAICFDRIVYNNDHLSDPSLKPHIDFLTKNDWLSACAAPIHRAGKIWGVIALIADEKNIFNTEILGFVSKISALISHSLDEIDIKRELEEEKRKSEYLAYHDTLTGLPNRLLLESLLDGAVKRADRSKTYLGVGMIDFDDFKHINDTFGHDWGDYLLKEFAKRVKGVLRKTDHLVRLGGDEFVIIAEDLKDKSDISLLMSRLEKSFEKPFAISGQNINLKISLGITIYPLDKQPPNILLIHADNAMYGIKAKKGERETFWEVYSEQDDNNDVE